MTDEAPQGRATLSLSFDAIEPTEVQSDEGAALLHALGVPTLRVQCDPHPARAVELTPEERMQLTEWLWQTLMTLAERHRLIDPEGAYQTRLEASLTVGLHLDPDPEDEDAKAHPAGPEGALLDALAPPSQAEESSPPDSSGPSESV